MARQAINSFFFSIQVLFYLVGIVIHGRFSFVFFFCILHVSTLSTIVSCLIFLCNFVFWWNEVEALVCWLRHSTTYIIQCFPRPTIPPQSWFCVKRFSIIAWYIYKSMTTPQAIVMFHHLNVWFHISVFFSVNWKMHLCITFVGARGLCFGTAFAASSSSEEARMQEILE